MIGICLTLIDTEQEKQKFVALYEGYKKLMFYIANDILKNSHLAEEAVQEAFLRIAKNFHKIDDVSCPQTKAFVVLLLETQQSTYSIRSIKYRRFIRLD